MSDMITRFLPAPQSMAADLALAAIDGLSSQAMPPFHSMLINMLADLSRRLLKSPLAKTAPQLTVAGYWLRPAALKNTAAAWQERTAKDCIPAPRGVALHLPPANVDTLFLYSWALSVLAGNCNVVRLPSSLTPVGEVILTEIMACLAAHDQTGRHLFLHFDHSGPLAPAISAKSDLRLIWGGDAKVADASRHIMRPDGISLGFPDRFSFATIKATAWLTLNEEARKDLTAQFYNDMFWFDQLGCGSPRILYWVGTTEEAEKAAKSFWAQLDQTIIAKSYETEVGVAIAKFSWATKRAAAGDVQRFDRFSNALMVITPTQSADLHHDVQGGGMLAHIGIDSLDHIVPRVRRKDQTMTHFGFERDELETFARAASIQGICRIVPIGQALAFEPIWDGIDLLSSMTRLVSLRL
jgi:hypothetical protein